MRSSHWPSRLWLALWITVFCSYFSSYSHAQGPTQIPSGSQPLPPPHQTAIDTNQIDQFERLLPTIMIYRDYDRQAIGSTIDQLWLRGQFEAPNRDSAGQGLVRYPIWGRFELSNPTKASKELVLEYIDHSLVYMDLYSMMNGKIFHHGHASYFKPFDQRPIEHLRYAFPVTLAPEETRTFYVRMSIKNAGPLFTDMRVWNVRDFDKFKHKEMFIFGAFFGYLSIILMGSLVAYYSTGHNAILFYSVYVLSNIYGWGSITGFLPEIFFRDGFHWRHMIIGGAVNVTFSALFTRSLLNTPRFLPRLDKYIVALAIFGTIPIVSSVLDASFMAVMSMEIQLLGMGILMAAGILRARQGEKVALVFTLAWAIYVSGMTIYPLREFGIVDHNPFTYWWSPAGAIIEVSLLLGVIILWIRNNQRSKIKARQQYLQGLEVQKNHLEQEVQARTADLQSAKEKAEREARTDSLTQLPNRRQFMERLELELNRSQRHKLPMCFMLIDLDYFKRINDDYGHTIGDQALLHVAKEIGGMIRSYDLFARFGGEEFALLMTETDIDEGEQFANRIRQHLADTPLQIGDLPIHMTLTAGLIKVLDNDNSSGALSRADNLLYKGKSQGRNLVCTQEFNRADLSSTDFSNT